MTNLIGHGHVIPRDDGYKAKCGGPAVCSVCKAEAQSNFAGYANMHGGPVAVYIGPSDWNPKPQSNDLGYARLSPELEQLMRDGPQYKPSYDDDDDEKLYTQADLDAAIAKERARCAAHVQLSIDMVSKAASEVNPSGHIIDTIHKKALLATVSILQTTLYEIEAADGARTTP